MSSTKYQPYSGDIERIPLDQKIKPAVPSKRINTSEDLHFFLSSSAYKDISVFVRQLNHAIFPRYRQDENGRATVRPWPTTSLSIIQSPQVMRIKVLVQTLQSMLKEAPAETGPRRYGNAAFRTWHKLLQERVPSLLQQALPENIWYHVAANDRAVLKEELAAYLVGAFGSSERLDYGTGHELSFIAFLACVWKLNGFAPSENGSEERAIIVGVIEPYIELVRKLIQTYTLEPAGSHGVWGLDDHFFVPYIFGSAQFSSALGKDGSVPMTGGWDNAPPPGIITSEATVKQQANQNMYLSAIRFIYSVKKGPFWEHSPTLYDISGIADGWAKINKGLLKMFDAEVLSKFPVVQHFPFGSLFAWKRDPDAPPVQFTAHSSSLPPPSVQSSVPSASMELTSGAGPWNGDGNGNGNGNVNVNGNGVGTAAPWTRRTSSNTPTPTPAAGSSSSSSSSRPRLFGQSSGDQSTLARLGRFARTGSSSK